MNYNLKFLNLVCRAKKEKNFIINKQITKLLSKKYEKCKPYHMLNAFICKNCDKHAFMFMQYLGCFCLKYYKQVIKKVHTIIIYNEFFMDWSYVNVRNYIFNITFM